MRFIMKHSRKRVEPRTVFKILRGTSNEILIGNEEKGSLEEQPLPKVQENKKKASKMHFIMKYTTHMMLELITQTMIIISV